MIDIHDLSPPTCDCTVTAVRTRTRSNGVACYVLQCQGCGRELRAVKKTAPEVLALTELPRPFDDALIARWNERWRVYQDARQQVVTERQREWEARQQELEAQRQAQAAQREAANEAWWAWYSEYLRTPAWRAKRQRVLRRAQGMCEGCLEQRATEVHHLTYAHVGDELLFELVAVCGTCHARIHEVQQ